MKGLRKYLAPFAPDQSGAVSVLFAMGGILVICDAGGCTGNICGFDEPRWLKKKSAVFSAGLRDMDAILGRDEKLAAKLCDAAKKISAQFAAIIGTPVPSVIGTDYNALCKMVQNKLEFPVLAVPSTGMELYDKGEEMAYLALVEAALRKDGQRKEEKGTICVLGATPLELSLIEFETDFVTSFKEEGTEKIYCLGTYRFEKTQDILLTAEKNIVVSPSGMKAAKKLYETYKIPYEVHNPYVKHLFLKEDLSFCKGKKVLIIHQQFMANELRTLILSYVEASITVASWFMMLSEYEEEGDRSFKEEDDFIEFIKKESFDVIFGDEIYQRALPFYQGRFIPFTHYAVSGNLNSIDRGRL